MCSGEEQRRLSPPRCLYAVRLVFVGLCCALVLGVWSTASAGEPADGCGDPETALAGVQARYDAINDLSAKFVQATESVVLAGSSPGLASTSRGEVVLAKPGRMRWTYETPEPSVVVSDGRLIWIHDVAGRQVTRASVDGGYLAGAALQFLLGAGRLEESFEVKEVGCSAGQIELDLTPTKPASYERIRATVDRASGLISETSVHDLFGNRTTLTFSEIDLNRAPPDSRFVFEPPEGVEVIDMDAPH